VALRWTDDRDTGLVREVATGGEWRGGVYVPAQNNGSSAPRNTIIHDIVRTLLELRAQ
jgi:hypothetical protein